MTVTPSPADRRRIVRRWGWPLFALATAGISSAGCRKTQTPATLELRPATAEVIRAAVVATHGAVVIVNLWATWCQPCVEELPELLRFYREHRTGGVRLLLVSADFSSQRAAVLARLRALGISGTSYLKQGDDMAFIEGLAPQWSGSLPATLLFDSKGKLRELVEGSVGYERLAQLVDRVRDKERSQR